MTVVQPEASPYPLVAVVAMSSNRVIGDGEGLLWHLPGDLQRVKTLTMAKPLIMGRRTYMSIGRPLPGRQSIILSQNRNWQPPPPPPPPEKAAAETGFAVCGSMKAAITAAATWIEAAPQSRKPEIILFGGGAIYRLGLPYVSRIELTLIHREIEGSVSFPQLDMTAWRETARQEIAATGTVPAHAYITLQRLT